MSEQQTEQQRIEGADTLRQQVAKLQLDLLAETEAKHEAVELLRKIAYEEITNETVAHHLGILEKHGVLKHD